MKIGEFSQITGLSVHTLRYYEKIGLLTVGRDSSGHRRYASKEVEWVGFINRLRETAMPLKQIQQYATWRSQGNETVSQRRQLLENHAQHLEAIIEKEQSHLKALQKKINFYRENP